MPAFSRFLRYFMVVGRTGSIRRAADILHVSASAIDRQILQAEQTLGVPLFERLPTGLRLTAAGELMMAAGGRWQKGLAELCAQIDDLAGLRRGHVDIALIDALAKGIVPQVLHGIQQEFPGITPRLAVLENAKVQAALLSGKADFGILLAAHVGRALAVRAHAEVRLGFVVRPDHPLAQERSCRFSVGAHYRLVTPAEPLALCEQVTALSSAAGIELDIAASTDNVQMLKSLVAEGLGVGLLTSIDVVSEVETGELAFVAIEDPIVRPLTLALCVVPTRSLSHAANFVLSRIEEGFARLGAPGSTPAESARPGPGQPAPA